MNCCRSKTLVKLKREVVSPSDYKLSNYSSSRGIGEMRACACTCACACACMRAHYTYIRKNIKLNCSV